MPQVRVFGDPGNRVCGRANPARENLGQLLSAAAQNLCRSNTELSHVLGVWFALAVVPLSLDLLQEINLITFRLRQL
jgi:hypothetical protein